jgi:hypothetical protein
MKLCNCRTLVKCTIFFNACGERSRTIQFSILVLSLSKYSITLAAVYELVISLRQVLDFHEGTCHQA